jgi:hypothetical protein
MLTDTNEKEQRTANMGFDLPITSPDNYRISVKLKSLIEAIYQ